MKIAVLSQIALNKAISALKKEGVIICPTDTIYGFLADATNKKAVDKIFKIKKRPRSKPLPIFVSGIKQAKEIAKINKDQEKFLKKRWPGKYTFILKRKPGIKLFGVDKNTIALRIPKYKFLNDLLKKVNKPLVQTSVNISGKEPSNKIKDIILEFRKKDILIIDAGDLSKSKPSKIIDLTGCTQKTIRY